MARVVVFILALAVAAIFFGPLAHLALHFALVVLHAVLIGVAYGLAITASMAALGAGVFGLSVWLSDRRHAVRRSAPRAAAHEIDPGTVLPWPEAPVAAPPPAPVPHVHVAGEPEPKPATYDQLARRGIRVEWKPPSSTTRHHAPGHPKRDSGMRIPLEWRD
jgi:hypothetical protein